MFRIGNWGALRPDLVMIVQTSVAFAQSSRDPMVLAWVPGCPPKLEKDTHKSKKKMVEAKTAAGI